MPQGRRQGRRPGQLRPGPHGMPPEEVARSQRDRLLAAVIEVVAAAGYDNARVADVISAAGVSRKTFYEHFDEKEDCFLAAYDLEVARLGDVTEQAFRGGGDSWPERVRSGVRGLLGYLAANPEVARVCVVEVMGAGPRAVARREATLRGFTHFVDAGRGSTQGEVPGRTALALIGGLNELIASSLLHRSAEQLEDLAPDVTYLICLPFLGSSRAEAERRRAQEELDEGPGR